MSDLERHALRIAERMAAIEAGEGEVPREQLFALLEDVDHLHRTCVWRLFEKILELGGKGLVERLAADPAVKTLFVLYDLIPDRPLQPVAADARVTAPNQGGFVPLGALRKKTAWRVAFATEDLPPGTLQAVEVEGMPVLLCALDEARGGQVTAFKNACPGTVLPLHLGGLAGGEIRCPWHGCRFDAATGRRLDGDGGDLTPLEAERRGDTIHIALEATPPELPEPPAGPEEKGTADV